MTRNLRFHWKLACLSVALAILSMAGQSRAQELQVPDGALVEPEDAVEPLYEPNDARVPPDAYLLPLAAAPAASGLSHTE